MPSGTKNFRIALGLSYRKVAICMQLFDWIYIGEVGAHDGDWEHVTLRLSPDARQVLGMYYSAHRYSCTSNQTASTVPAVKGCVRITP